MIERAIPGISKAASLALGLAVSAAAHSYSPYGGEAPSTRLFWGDTHLHSSLSSDAFGLGVTLGPDQAFRFAAGENVETSGGLKARLSRPLDFVVLADHAESLGLMNLVAAGDPRMLADDEVRYWHRMLHGSREQQIAFRRLFLDRATRQTAFSKLNAAADDELKATVWQQSLASAESHNRPGVFTTLLGYEWTSAPGGSNLHRVVVFRDGRDRVGQALPLSSRGHAQPDELWDTLENYERDTGGQVLAIPHNGNLSNGLMFPDAERYGGESVDERYVRRRSRWEPVVEVTQIKGDGEAHPALSPQDPFASYETWDFGNFEGVPKTPDMLRFEYARPALQTGLKLESELGTNPYAFGMIGSTDSHTALAAVAENNFFGKHSGVEPTPQRGEHVMGRGGKTVVKGWQQAASGYAAVWAQANDRASLWDAIKRREVYATTGPRITVRFFGGWDFSPGDAVAPDIARRGYASGVPMGGALNQAPAGKSATFLVAASKDAIGANLDRIQVVKGWIDETGKTHEQVFDVVWSGAREIGEDGELPPVGSTVDLTTATWTNAIGSAHLAGVWRDPDFDPSQSSFYYLRVLEIPTPRWTAYDAARLGAAFDETVAMTTVERAYTSPIWYRPDPA
ncbi:MAG: DUF3604 domain-containing protein [Pseudomonadota bacterium]